MPALPPSNFSTCFQSAKVVLGTHQKAKATASPEASEQFWATSGSHVEAQQARCRDGSDCRLQGILYGRSGHRHQRSAPGQPSAAVSCGGWIMHAAQSETTWLWKGSAIVDKDVPPPPPAKPKLSAPEQRARREDRLAAIRLRMAIGRELEDREITTRPQSARRWGCQRWRRPSC